jgi:long-chain acyl-CoA synthetase
MMSGWLIFNITANFPEEPETVMENLREIGPAALLLSPMQWQGLVSMVQMKVFETGVLRRLLYRICLWIGYQYADYKLKYRAEAPWHWKILYSLANWLCLMHIRDALGLRPDRTHPTNRSRRPGQTRHGRGTRAGHRDIH